MSRITLDVPEALHRQIKVEAAQRGISIREYLLRALEVRRDAGTEPPRRTFSDSGLAGLWADRDDLRDPAQWEEGRAIPTKAQHSPLADDPFHAFQEWHSEADERAYGQL